LFAELVEIPRALVPSFECRRSVCRTELRWTPEYGRAYTAALIRAVSKDALPLGIEDAGPRDAEGLHPVVVYIALARPPASSIERASSE
jgi:hypothetical protein